MEREMKRKVFALLADNFETDRIREYFLDMVEEIPDYIFTMPHPQHLENIITKHSVRHMVRSIMCLCLLLFWSTGFG